MTGSLTVSHPFLSMFIGIALGLYVITFSRFMYRSPDLHNGSWKDTLRLPQSPKAWKFTRAFGAILLFLGCIVLESAIFSIFPIPRGATTLWIALGGSVVATILLLPRKLPPSPENLRESRRRLLTPEDIEVRRRRFREERAARKRNRRKP
jgi:hypothetical protein